MSADYVAALVIAASIAALPILLAALGEFVVEKAGALNVGVEGMMLAGAFAAFALERLGLPPSAALCVVVGVGAAAGLGFGVLTVSLRCEPVVTGLMLNTLVLGATAVSFDALLEFVVARDGALAATLAVRGVESSVLAAMTVGVAVVIAIVVPRTRLGLRLRACGYDADAARATGVNVGRLRIAALTFGGCVAAAAGAALLVTGPGTFVEGMTEGRGFLAVAAVVCARGHLWRVVVFALVFGALTVFQFHAQSLGGWSHHLLLALPYALTLAALALARSSRANVRSAPAESSRPTV